MNSGTKWTETVPNGQKSGAKLENEFYAMATFSRNSIGEGFDALVAGLAEVPHEEADVGPEALLGLAAEVANHPLRVVNVLQDRK